MTNVDLIVFQRSYITKLILGSLKGKAFLNALKLGQ